jgi:ribosomal protein S27E
MKRDARIIDLSGQRFGRWLVYEMVENHKPRGTYWRAQCDCGTTRIVYTGDLRRGKSVSCGCFKTEATGARSRTHGESTTRLYGIWDNMRRRCADPDAKGYLNYGGRGISVCVEWADFLTFKAWALASGYSADLTLERREIDGNYEPGNCEWATMKAQARNKRTTKRAPDGTPWCSIAEANGVPVKVFGWRTGQLGWPPERAATQPVAKRRPALTPSP